MIWFRSGSLTNNIRFLVVTVTGVYIQHGQLCRFHSNDDHPMVLGYHYFVEKLTDGEYSPTKMEIMYLDKRTLGRVREYIHEEEGKYGIVYGKQKGK